MLEKTARKPSSDPAQEKLRQDKANWNKDVSAFINDVIHLKKLMNGWPNKFFKERSRITTPIPADPNTILGSLANDFQELAQRGESIVSEQLNYSKSRRQKQPQAPQAPAPQEPATPEAPAAPQAPAAPAQPDLAKQLAAWEQKYGDSLVAEGSNKLTRTVTRLLNVPGKIPYWTSGAKRRRNRMNMLKRSADVYKLLGKLQVKIVAPFSNKQSIKDSYELLRAIKNQWASVGDSLKLFKQVAGEEMTPEETAKELQEVKKTIQDAKKSDKAADKAEQVVEEAKEEKAQQAAPAEPVVQTQAPVSEPQAPAAPFIGDREVNVLAGKYSKDFTSIVGGKIYNPSAFSNLGQAIQNWTGAPKVAKPDMARIVMNEYANALSQLNGQYGTNATSLKGIETQLADKARVEWEAKQKAAPPGVNYPKSSNASDQLEAVAQAALKKWVGRMRHETLPNDTSDFRINIFDKAKELRAEIDVFMNLAESRKSLVPQYEKQYEKIGAEITKLNSYMLNLYRLYFRVPKDLTESLGLS